MSANKYRNQMITKIPTISTFLSTSFCSIILINGLVLNSLYTELMTMIETCLTTLLEKDLSTTSNGTSDLNLTFLIIDRAPHQRKWNIFIIRDVNQDVTVAQNCTSLISLFNMNITSQAMHFLLTQPDIER